jgi:hypothetical protein
VIRGFSGLFVIKAAFEEMIDGTLQVKMQSLYTSTVETTGSRSKMIECKRLDFIRRLLCCTDLIVLRTSIPNDSAHLVLTTLVMYGALRICVVDPHLYYSILAKYVRLEKDFATELMLQTSRAVYVKRRTDCKYRQPHFLNVSTITSS